MEPAVEPVFACAPPPGTARVDVVLAVVRDGVPARVLRRLPEGYRPLAVTLRGGDEGLGAAWAQGLAASTAPVVALVDGRCGVDPRELERVAEPVARGSADAVLGTRRPGRGPASLLAWPPHRRLADAAAVRRTQDRLRHERTGADLALLDVARVVAARRQLLLTVEGAGPEELVVAAAAAGWRLAQVGVLCGAGRRRGRRR